MAAMRTKDGSFTLSLLFAVFLLVMCALIVSRLRDPVSTDMEAGAKP